MSEPINITDSNFESDVLGSDKPVLVDFWATWCGPCRMIAPTVKEIAAEYGDQVDVVKVDIDENPMTPGRYGVMSIPTLMIFKDGQVVDRWVGAQPKDAMVARLLPHMNEEAAA